MLKELFETGKTVDAAIDSACEKLGCKREDCNWEIIDLPAKKFLGLKSIPAKVRVSIEVPDERHIEEKPQAKPKPRQQTSAPASAPMREKKQAEQKEQVVNEADVSEKENTAKEYLKEVLTAAGLNAEYKIIREHGGSSINISGEGLGMIIGRRGETLDALQYLTGLVANRSGGDYLRFTIDCGEYRTKRRDTLEALAKRLAGQVLKTNVSKTLEPMNPFERRIIHSTVHEIEGVSSISVGEEPNRRVVITSPTSKAGSRSGFRTGLSSRADGGAGRGRPPRRDSRRQGGDYGDAAPRGDRPERPRHSGTGAGRRPQAAPAASRPPKQTPESEATTGISFGKIDLE